MNKSKLLIFVLLISVSINLFLIGGITYRMSRGADFGPRPLPPNVSWIVRDLSEARQAELAPFLEGNREASNSLRRQMFEAQRRINSLMASANFDDAELNQAFSVLREASSQYQTLSHQQTVDILNLLSAEERAAAQEFVQRRGPRDGRQGPGGRRFEGSGQPDGDRRRPPPPEPQNNGANL